MGGMVQPAELDPIVAEAIKNAVSNGYDEVKTNDSRVVAIDMLAFDAAVEAKMADVEDLEDAINQVAESITRYRKANG